MDRIDIDAWMNEQQKQQRRVFFEELGILTRRPEVSRMSWWRKLWLKLTSFSA